MNKILFSERLKTRRIECGYKTQYALAKEYNQRFPSSRKNRKEENIKNSTGILGTIKHYENGNYKGSPKLDIVDNLCKILECDVDYLLGNIDCKKHDLQFVHNQTGLSEIAILELRQLYAETAVYGDANYDLDIINTLIEQLNYKNNSVLHWLTIYLHSKGLRNDLWYYTESGTISAKKYISTEAVIHLEEKSDTFDNLILMGLENRIKALKPKSKQ